MNIRTRLCACAADGPSSGFRDTRRSIGMRVRREYSHGCGNFSLRKRVHPFPLLRRSRLHIIYSTVGSIYVLYVSGLNLYSIVVDRYCAAFLFRRDIFV